GSDGAPDLDSCPTRRSSDLAARNLRCACRVPAVTTAMPYSGICGRNSSSIDRPACAPASPPCPRSISSMTGPASTTPINATGTSSSRVQPSSADTGARTCSGSPRCAAAAKSGTTTLASAPPATISNTTFGMAFAVAYTLPSTVAPTWDWNTSCRPKPATRAATLITAISAAPPAMPAVAPVATRRAFTTSPDLRPAAEAVHLAQDRRALDDLGEADLLTDQGQRCHDRQMNQPGPAAFTRHQRQAEQRTERVRAAVTQHRAFAEVVREARRGSAQRGG